MAYAPGTDDAARGTHSRVYWLVQMFKYLIAERERN
jgi:hypothetical protein